MVLAANSGATINDITAAELQPLLLVAAEGDKLLSDSLASGQLKVVSSGNDMPVIDISKVCGCLNIFEISITRCHTFGTVRGPVAACEWLISL